MFRRRRSVDDFVKEIKSHFELEADELQSEGLSEEEAGRRARVAFGDAPAAQNASISVAVSYGSTICSTILNLRVVN